MFYFITRSVAVPVKVASQTQPGMIFLFSTTGYQNKHTHTQTCICTHTQTCICTHTHTHTHTHRARQRERESID